MSGHAELFQRLDEILVEESPMHPFGCATWMEATQIAIDMAKRALSRPPVVHGWPEREAVEDALDVTLHRWRALDADKTEEAVRGFARESVRPLLAALTDGEGE